jgi:hypothetical protein
MQLNKASKKTSKVAEKAAAPSGEEMVPAETAVKPRIAKSSKAKKSEGTDMTSGKNLHKPAKNTIVESTPRVEGKPEGRSVTETRKKVVAREKIAELAYSYWVERGYLHGAAEEDWLRAERELVAS